MKLEQRTDLLRILANHLLDGKLGHKKFDFSVYNTGELDENKCGTTGCAIGECPIVWPEYFHFKYLDDFTYVPTLIGTNLNTIEAAMQFFKLNSYQYSYLFLPSIELDSTKITKGMIARNIISFCNTIDYYKNKIDSINTLNYVQF